MTLPVGSAPLTHRNANQPERAGALAPLGPGSVGKVLSSKALKASQRVNTGWVGVVNGREAAAARTPVSPVLQNSCACGPDSEGDGSGFLAVIFKAECTHLHKRQTPASTTLEQQNSLKFCSGVNGLGGFFFLLLLLLFFPPRHSRQSPGRRLNPTQRSSLCLYKGIINHSAQCCLVDFRSGSGSGGCLSEEEDAALMISS